MPLKREYVLKTLVQIVAETARIEAESITEQSSLCRGADSLFIDSLTVHEIATNVEDTFEQVYDFQSAIRKHRRIGPLVDHIVSLG